MLLPGPMTSTSRNALVLSVATGLLVVVAPARAAGAGPATDPCLTAPVDGQKLRRAGKLLEARKSFTFCARDACPREVVQACTRWEHELEASVPSVVLGARDDAGRDVTARVAIDGGEPVDLGLRALELDPGEHRFVFTRSAGSPVEQRVVLREGEKNRVVTAIFPAPRADATPSNGADPGPSPRPAPAPSWWTPLRTTGAVAGAVGAAALITGFVLAGVAKTRYDAAREECGGPNDCPHDAVTRSDQARSLGDVATVIVIAGASVAVAGTALLLFAPSPSPASSARVGIGGGPLSLHLVARW